MKYSLFLQTQCLHVGRMGNEYCFVYANTPTDGMIVGCPPLLLRLLDAIGYDGPCLPAMYTNLIVHEGVHGRKNMHKRVVL